MTMSDEGQNDEKTAYYSYEEFRQKFYKSNTKSSEESVQNADRESASFGKRLARDVMNQK
jgi:hypothetical protein